jgi:hypothetical protein
MLVECSPTKVRSNSYDINAKFKETEGSGTRNEGLGIVGRPCTFEFAEQQAPNESVAH